MIVRMLLGPSSSYGVARMLAGSCAGWHHKQLVHTELLLAAKLLQSRSFGLMHPAGVRRRVVTFS